MKFISADCVLMFSFADFLKASNISWDTLTVIRGYVSDGCSFFLIFVSYFVKYDHSILFYLLVKFLYNNLF